MLKMAIITSFLSQTKDRFHLYNQPLDLDGKFALLSTIEGYNGVEIVYPYEVNDVKPSETRGRCFVDSAAKTLCLLNDIKINEMGVTLDFGHSMYGSENPAEAVALLEASPFKYYIHINDNDGKWDWDYFCGTKHFLDYVEFLYYLKKYD